MIANELISEIKSKINDNEKQAITGGVLQGVLVDMVDGLNVESIPGEMIEAGAVTTDKIADEAVTEEKLASQSVSSKKIKDATIGASKLGVNSVTTAKIKDGAVTIEKLAPGVIDGGGGEFIFLDVPIGKTQLPDGIALRLFGSLSSAAQLQTIQIFCKSPALSSLEVQKKALLAFSGAEVIRDASTNEKRTRAYFSKATEKSIGARYKFIMIDFTAENGHIYADVADVLFDLFTFMGGQSPNHDTFVTYNLNLVPGRSLDVKNLSRYPYFIYAANGLHTIVTYLSSAQVEALTAKVADQFNITPADSANLRNAYVKPLDPGKKMFVSGDDISNISAVIYADKIYFFK